MKDESLGLNHILAADADESAFAASPPNLIEY
jgi:hypothetical protein